MSTDAGADVIIVYLLVNMAHVYLQMAALAEIDAALRPNVVYVLTNRSDVCPQMQAQMAALAEADAALRRAQPRPPRTPFSIFTENMQKCSSLSLIICLSPSVWDSRVVQSCTPFAIFTENMQKCLSLSYITIFD